MTFGNVNNSTTATPLPNEDWHFGFRLSNHSALEQWHEKLKAKGMHVGEWCGNDRYKSFYIQDPEGNDIEFFCEDAPD